MSLVHESATRMAATQYLITTLSHHFKTLLFSADIFECWTHGWRCLSYLFLTVSAFSGFFVFFELSTSFAQMIGFSLALGTEVFAAIPTSYSKFTHMDGSLPI